jgi:hypothetical protein
MLSVRKQIHSTSNMKNDKYFKNIILNQDQATDLFNNVISRRRLIEEGDYVNDLLNSC